MIRLWDANAMVGKFPSGDLLWHSLDGLREHMDRLGIERALVYHSLAWHHDPAVGNRLLIEQIAGDQRLIPCWVILPPSTGELGTPSEFVDAMERHGVKAVRAFPKDHVYRLAGPDCEELLGVLAHRRVPLLVDVEQSDWGEIEAVAAQYPDLPVVACRIGYRSLRRIAPILARRPNVYLDLAYFATHGGVEWVAQQYGVDRLLFGTGAPFTDPGGAVTRLMYADLPAADLAAIGAGNLQRLLGEEGKA